MDLTIWDLNNVKDWFIRNKFMIKLAIIFIVVYVIFIYFDYMNYNYLLWVSKWENITPAVTNINGSFKIFNFSDIQ